MKEATGELNMTVVTVVAIAAVAAFFYAFVWPAIKNNINKNTYCSMATCTNCTTQSNGNTVCDCTYDEDADGNDDWEGKCTFEGAADNNTTP